MSQFDLKKFLVENKLTSNSRRMTNEYGKGRSLRGKPVFAPEWDPSLEPDVIEVFMDAAGEESVFNQKLVNDIQALLDRADYNGKLDLSAVDDPEDEVVRVLVDVWESGNLPHTISDYVHPEVLIRQYGFTQEELDEDRAEYLDSRDYKPLDEGDRYDYPIDRHDRDYTAEDITHLAHKYGLSMEEMYRLVQDYGVDGVIAKHDKSLDEFFYYGNQDVKYTPEEDSGSEVGRFRSFLRQIKTSDVDLASYLGVSVAELYDILDRDGVDAIMDAYDTAQDKNADFMPESFQKKRR